MMEQKKLIELVKKIREETGLGVMEIKVAVDEAEGDEKKVKEILKKKGFEKAEKKAERETHQGRIATYTHNTGKIGVMVELLCETDFVAKNEEFLAVARDLCLQVTAMAPKNAKALMSQEFVKDPSKKVEELIHGLVMKFGENIKIGRIERFEI
jgi:elongation factor Ts